MRPTSRALLAASLFSGYAALGYEVLWTRIATYLIGSDAYALGAVLGLFSASLALGAALSSRWVSRENPLRAYALVEGATALAGGFQGVLWLRHREAAERFLSDVATKSPFGAVAICGAALVVLPGVLMGTTLPLLVAARPGPAAARDLYASNLVGACVGALSMGGLVIPWLSVSKGFWIAATCNVVAAVAAILTPFEVDSAPLVVPSARLDFVVSRPVVCAFVAGVGSFSLEVLLFRVLRTRLGSGSTDWTVALLVGSFLLGLAFGGWMFERLEGDASLGTRVALSGPSLVLPVILLVFATRVPEVVGAVSTPFSLRQTAFTAAVLVAMAAPFGYLFPYWIVWEARRDEARASGATGRVLVGSALGNLCGSISAAFAVAPVLGSLHGLAMPVAALGVVSILVPREPSERGWGLSLGSSAFAVIAVLAAPAWVMQPGVRRVWMVGSAEDAFGSYVLAKVPRGDLWLFRYGQPLSATSGNQLENTHLAFDVIEESGRARSRIVAAGLGGACHLREVLVRSSRDSSLFRDVSTVEMSPAVIGLAAKFYDLPNGSLSRVVRADFRQKLREESADVYYIDLLSPAVEGSGFAFTREFHEEVRDSLSPHGLVIQWLGRFDVIDFLPEITRTLHDVYGGGFIVRSKASYYLFIASKDPAENVALGRALQTSSELARARFGEQYLFWPTVTVLARLGVHAPETITEDAIPFGRRISWRDDRKLLLAREEKLVGSAPILEGQ